MVAAVVAAAVAAAVAAVEEGPNPLLGSCLRIWWWCWALATCCMFRGTGGMMLSATRPHSLQTYGLKYRRIARPESQVVGC